MAEEWVKDARSEVKAEFDARSEVKKEVGKIKEDQAKLSEQLKEADRARDSSKASIKMLRSKLKNNANSCILRRLIWQRRGNW